MDGQFYKKKLQYKREFKCDANQASVEPTPPSRKWIVTPVEFSTNQLKRHISVDSGGEGRVNVNFKL